MVWPLEKVGNEAEDGPVVKRTGVVDERLKA